MRRLLSGAIAGFIATAPMTIVIMLGRSLRLLRTPPPDQITSNVVKRAGIEPDKPSEEYTATWVAAHFGYGAACGVLYALARPAIPGSTQQKGLLFGGAVWGVSYLGIIPALGLYPWPKQDAGTRMAVMIAAHAVFGIATAQIEQALAQMNVDEECYVTIQPPSELSSRRA